MREGVGECNQVMKELLLLLLFRYVGYEEGGGGGESVCAVERV
jgi:hypothetical protein